MFFVQTLLLNKYLLILVLAVVSFAQNMAFTASSRSRNSGNPLYHLKIAIASNGIWFTCHLLVWSQIWKAVSAFRLTGDWISSGLWLLLVAIVYIVSTSTGSSYMMKIMLKREKGDRQVGARVHSVNQAKYDFEKEIGKQFSKALDTVETKLKENVRDFK